MELFLLKARVKGRNGLIYLNTLIALLVTHYIQNYSNYLDAKNNSLPSSKFDRHQLEKIHDNIGNNISVDDFADLLGCSKFYFLREFKKLMGITPYQYLLTQRLKQAKQILMFDAAPIALVAHQFGFTDQSHFIRTFKSAYEILLRLAKDYGGSTLAGGVKVTRGIVKW